MLTIKQFGVCHLAVAPIRKSASDTSEIVTQLLFGDLVEILEEGQPWIKVKFPADAYEGYMDFKQLTYLEPNTYKELADSHVSYLSQPQLKIKGPDGEQTILFGSRLTGLAGHKMNFGGSEYILPSDFKSEVVSAQTSVHYFLNTPYLWGGKSLFGIDCSGIIQNIFKPHGILLPRDASAQVHCGQLIEYANRQVGDVPFFINAKGIVHHVGLLTQSNEIIHAAGCVRLDKFDEKGIFRTDLNRYTHHYHSIKRFDF